MREKKSLNILFSITVTATLLIIMFISMDNDYNGKHPRSGNLTVIPSIAKNMRVSCSSHLDRIAPLFSFILIDIDFLKQMKSDDCKVSDERLKVAASISLVNVINRLEYPELEILFYEMVKGRNYIKFFGNITRAIPLIPLKTIGNWRIPKNVNLFSKYWDRSPFIECLDIPMNRTNVETVLPIRKSLDALSNLREILVDLGMFPFLGGGTLLGWYRECGIIPHTDDMDFYVFIEEYNPVLEHILFNTNMTKFRITRKFGRPNDTYELTVTDRVTDTPTIDIFFMYNNGMNESWVGGTDDQGQKYQFYFPLYNPYCSADILGHLFWVTCTPHEMLEFEHGPEYTKDYATNEYAWNGAQKNVREADKWTETEMKEVYNIY